MIAPLPAQPRERGDVNAMKAGGALSLSISRMQD
jgi:hypothetical protein